jgi:hypothetical protein
MAMISPQDVVRRIETYYEGGALEYPGGETGEPGRRSGARSGELTTAGRP